jgi:hypothetical protein
MFIKPYLRFESFNNDETNEVATLELPAEPIKPVIRRNRGRLRKHPVTRDYLTFINTSAK